MSPHSTQLFMLIPYLKFHNRIIIISTFSFPILSSFVPHNIRHRARSPLPIIRASINFPLPLLKKPDRQTPTATIHRRDPYASPRDLREWNISQADFQQPRKQLYDRRLRPRISTRFRFPVIPLRLFERAKTFPL